jgi:predicted phosphodiesterase
MLEKLLFVPDSHVPYEDKKAFNLLLKAGAAFKPDRIIIIGDFADFYAVSSHSKNPNRRHDIQWEIEQVKARLKDLGRLGASRKYYVAGNHEDRLSRYLMDKAPALFNSVKIPEILNLREMGWEYTEYKDSLALGKLNITHDTGNCGPYAHYRAQEVFQGNVVIGHTHRLGYAVVGNAKGKPHVGAMLGWLGDFNQVDYMHKVQALRSWAHGFGIGYMEPNGIVHVQPVPIVEGKVIIEGKLIR